MDLYIITANGRAPRFEGTQAAAKGAAKLIEGKWEPIVVPDRKEERIAWLTSFAGSVFVNGKATMLKREEAKPRPDALPSEAFGRDMSAGAVISRSDNPGIDIDGIVETILAAKGCALKRFAGAVALAFTNLSKGS